MTREEAATIIKETIEIKDDQRLEALMMAIKALKTVKAINDLIDEYDIRSLNIDEQSSFEIKVVEAIDSGGEI
jgi:hypothetical protein